jgi:enamine deaminase RidA (YjgF/YER057c/UK114 family)
MDDGAILHRMRELGIDLPPVTRPVAAYIPVVIAGPLAFVAGQVPLVDGAMMHPGHVGADVSIDDAREAARRCALASLAALREELGSFDRLRRIAKVTVFISSAPGFVDQPKVANGASELLGEVLGAAGEHARDAVGVAELPLGAPVEVSVTAEVEP